MSDNAFFKKISGFFQKIIAYLKKLPLYIRGFYPQLKKFFASSKGFYNNTLKNKLNNKKNLVSIVVLGAIILLVVFMSVKQSTRHLEKKIQPFKDEKYGFTLQYPYAKKESKDSVAFSGSSPYDKIFHIMYYPEENIQKVINNWEKQNVVKDMKKLYEADVKVSTCTARKIDIGTASENKQSYYFISSGRSTILFYPKSGNPDADEILRSFTCL